MARVWFLVAVLIHIVLANENEIKESCDSCMRAGGNWCRRPGSDRCTFDSRVDMCFEPRPSIEATSRNLPENLFNPVYVQKTLDIGKTTQIEFYYVSPVEMKVNLTKLNTTQNFDINLNLETQCVNSKCTVTIKAMPKRSFCTPHSKPDEFIFLKLNFDNSTEEALVKYHIPCACECSRYVEKNSPMCNGKGNYSCGLCSPCQNGWGGDFCKEQVSCDPHRGDDAQCTHPEKNNVTCSDNGYCGHCDTCVCHTDRRGSQYFDEKDYCSDICMFTAKYDTCLKNNTIGKCSYLSSSITMDTLNKTVLSDLDEYRRFVWVECSVTIDDCDIEYAAMRTNDNENHVMVVKRSCDNPIADPHSGGNASVPIILSVLALLAVVLAAGGLIAWKHFNAVPPLPLSDSDYQNIGAEDCTGENPLYKSPMSSFKNPTYGKW